MFTWKKEEESTETSSSPSTTPNDSANTNNATTATNTNDNNSSDSNFASTSRIFSAGIFKTKSIIANTTSSIKAASEKAPVILATTTTSLNNTVKKTSAQLEEFNKTVASTVSSVQDQVVNKSQSFAKDTNSNTEKENQSEVNTGSTGGVVENESNNKTIPENEKDNESSSNKKSSLPSLPSLPSVSVPSLPSVSVPSLPSVSVPSIPSVSVPTVNLQSIEQAANNTATQTMNSLSSILPSRRYTVPDRAVASQVLMYRQILHTECKPGLRLSRGYEGTEAQQKVKHMPWWEQGVETTKKMVISYNNLIVRLWLNGAIMPYVDGGYASDHVNTTVPKDDDSNSNFKKEYDHNSDENKEKEKEKEEKGEGDEKEDTNDNDKDGNDSSIDNDKTDNSATNDDEPKPQTEQTNSSNPTHINTLIDSNGLPPIPHAYWVDRLGFQQTDPVTDFRSGGVLSLAMLVHIVEACPNVHARFLPSGDAHMLPFGITCINITDMLAKFCMFSKAVESMDALLSQKPFWRMFGDPNSLLVLQEISMEILCNVVVEMGRERKMPKVIKDYRLGSEFVGQDGTDKVTVFDFAEILQRTEKRVRDDLLGSGPKTVDELRAIHSRNYTKYMRALEKKEQQTRRQHERAMQKYKKGESGNVTYPDDDILAGLEEAKKKTKVMTDSVIGSAGGVLNKFKNFGFRSNETAKPTAAADGGSDNKNQPDTEEVDFAFSKSSKRLSQKSVSDSATTTTTTNTKNNTSNNLFDMSDAPAPPVIEQTTDFSVDELFNFDDADPSSNFTIDDDDFI